MEHRTAGRFDPAGEADGVCDGLAATGADELGDGSAVATAPTPATRPPPPHPESTTEATTSTTDTRRRIG
jgi:hypothetical protein